MSISGNSENIKIYKGNKPPKFSFYFQYKWKLQIEMLCSPYTSFVNHTTKLVRNNTYQILF